MSDGNSPVTDRRTVLKTAALAGVGGVSAVSTATAGRERSPEEFERHLQKAREIHDEAGIEQRVRYLEAHDIETGYARFVSSLPDRGEGPDAMDGTGQGDFCVEPDKCDGDIDLTLSLSYDMYNGRYFADLSMRYDYNLQTPESHGYYSYSGPQNPQDGAGILWERDTWKLQDRDDPTYCTVGDDNVEWDNGSWNYEGVGYRVDSRDIAEGSGSTSIGGAWSDTEHAGVYLRTGEDYTEGDSVNAAYRYTWSSGELSGVSVGYPWSVSVSVSSTTESEDLQTDLDGNSLRVTESDAH